jgi:activator of 2-hydroxyglutaryl-CoA dehydratase
LGKNGRLRRFLSQKSPKIGKNQLKKWREITVFTCFFCFLDAFSLQTNRKSIEKQSKNQNPQKKSTKTARKKKKKFPLFSKRNKTSKKTTFRVRVFQFFINKTDIFRFFSSENRLFMRKSIRFHPFFSDF